MEADQIMQVINKLIGPIEPIADASIDSERLKNMELLCQVFDKMHTQIDDVAYSNRNSPYGSVKAVVEVANKQLSKYDEDSLLSYHEWYLQNRGAVTNSSPEAMVALYLKREKG